MAQSKPISLSDKQHTLRLPVAQKEEALQWVQAQPAGKNRRPSEAPFRRLIDFWFSAIAWAVHHGLCPVDQSTGKKFVNIGPNPQDVRNFSPDRVALLQIIAVAEFGYEDHRIKAPNAIVDLGNRLAEAGATPLIAKLREIDDFAEPMLYRLCSVFQAAVSEASEHYKEGTF